MTWLPSGEKRGDLNRRRRWHPECLDEYTASDPGEMRRVMRKRDRGRCALCRLDTNALRRELKGRGRARKLRERGFKARQSLWEVDHIVPLIDGGGHEANNLQTLCTPCHKAKTAEEARSRAMQSRGTPDPGSCVPAVAPTARPPSPVSPAASRSRSLDELLERADLVNERAASLLAGFTSS